MFACLNTSSSSRRIASIAFLLLALLFCPAYVVFSWSDSLLPLFTGMLVSSACLTMAWLGQRKPAPVKRLW